MKGLQGFWQDAGINALCLPRKRIGGLQTL
jgi:hypothetical protein